MFKYIILPLFIINSYVTLAQTVVDARQTVDRNGIIYFKGETTPLTGTAISWFTSGKKQIETPYLNGKQNGIETTWFPDGKTMMEILKNKKKY